MLIRNSCIIQKIIDHEKMIVIEGVEQILHLPLSEVLVRWKRSFHWVRSNEIGDGMQVVVHADRPFMIAHLQSDRTVRGASLYKEFDEEVGFMKTYFYKFPKQEETYAYVQQLIREQLDGYAVVQDGRYTQLRGPQLDMLGLDAFKVSLCHAGVAGALSFLWGICLAYGGIGSAYDHDHIHVTVPLVGSIVSYHEHIQVVINMLQEHHMYVHMYVQDQSFGQSLQLRITDWEILTIFSHWITNTHTQVMRKKTYESLKKNMVAWLGKQTVNKAFLDKIELSVLKLVRK